MTHTGSTRGRQAPAAGACAFLCCSLYRAYRDAFDAAGSTMAMSDAPRLDQRGALPLALPPDSKASVTVDLAVFRRLIVRGREGRRTLRAVRADGTRREWTPLWSPPLEQTIVVAFLQRRLPAACPLSVEAPQTLWASICQERSSTTVDPFLHCR